MSNKIKTQAVSLFFLSWASLPEFAKEKLFRVALNSGFFSYLTLWNLADHSSNSDRLFNALNKRG